MISGIPLHVHFEDIEPLLKPFGKVEDCAVVASQDPNTQTVHITYENFDQAQRYFCVLSHPSRGDKLPEREGGRRERHPKPFPCAHRLNIF